MTDKQYIYAVARIRSKELTLFSKSDIDQLMSCKSEKECLRFISDRGWGRTEETDSEQILSDERNRTWDLIRELVEDISVFNTFLYGNDFHNLKAAIKQVYSDSDLPDIYIPYGTVEPEIFHQAVKEHDFMALPECMRECAEEAYQVQLHTGDSQLCEVIIDKASLDTIYQKAKETENGLFIGYAERKVAFADINIIIRSIRTGKDKKFMERALAKCDSLNTVELISAAQEGEDKVLQYLASTPYADAIPAIKTSNSAFERWCDNQIIELIRPQKYNPFTVSPLAAYILARENEIKTVRILLSGKKNEISDNTIRERLRDMYV